MATLYSFNKALSIRRALLINCHVPMTERSLFSRTMGKKYRKASIINPQKGLQLSATYTHIQNIYNVELNESSQQISARIRPLPATFLLLSIHFIMRVADLATFSIDPRVNRDRESTRREVRKKSKPKLEKMRFNG